MLSSIDCLNKYYYAFKMVLSMDYNANKILSNLTTPGFENY